MVLSFLVSRPLSVICGFVYPAYCSFKALETQDTTEDDKQWLMYWTIFGLFTFCEFFLDWFFFLLPFYYELKLAFILWLQLPQFRGAKYLYLAYIKPILTENESFIDSQINNLLGSVCELGAQALTIVQSKASAAVALALDKAVSSRLASSIAAASEQRAATAGPAKHPSVGSKHASPDEDQAATGLHRRPAHPTAEAVEH